jgi:GT2 family glycosyltransferase
MKVSINLVTWNGKKYLPYCFESIFKQTFRDFSLFILDNGSTDGTVEFIKSQISNLKSQISDLKVIFNEKNAGFAAGHNRAVRETESEYVFMLNQDIILEPNFLEVIIKFLDENPSVGAATGKLLRWNFEKNEKTDMLDSAGLKIFKSHRVIELGAGENDSEKWNEPRETFGVSGAAPIYRRKALREVTMDGQVFDEDFFSYKEDVDLAYRLRLRGWRAWFLPEARAYHDRTARATAGGDFGAMRQRKNKSSFVNYHSYKNHLFFLVKDVPAGIYWRCGCRIKWYEFKKFVYLLFFETATLMGLGEFFKKLPRMWKKRKLVMATKTVETKEIRRWLR